MRRKSISLILIPFAILASLLGTFLAAGLTELPERTRAVVDEIGRLAPLNSPGPGGTDKRPPIHKRFPVNSHPLLGYG